MTPAARAYQMVSYRNKKLTRLPTDSLEARAKLTALEEMETELHKDADFEATASPPRASGAPAPPPP